MYPIWGVERAEGSVAVGNDYQATSTDTGWTAGIAKQVKPCTTRCPGSLGTVLITFSSTLGSLKIYDATTTNIALRTGNTPTSTITIASFPTLTAGAYPFDVDIKNGLMVEVGGLIASSTITYR